MPFGEPSEEVAAEGREGAVAALLTPVPGSQALSMGYTLSSDRTLGWSWVPLQAVLMRL